jgi:hypothetical protein
LRGLLETMRCTRCDGIAVPQTLGRLPDGRLAFGLCLRCLMAEGADQIEIAPRGRHAARRLMAAAPTRRADPRLRGVRALAGLLAAWGLALAVVGASSGGSHPGAPPSPFGNGTPALLLVGALAMAGMGLGLSMAASRVQARKNQSSHS